MQKGFKRNNKGIAVVRFFCGLIFVAILVFAAYCLLDKFDWSDSMKDPSASTRPYVEVTAAPEATEVPVTPTPEAAEEGDIVDISEPDEVTEPVETATATPKPTATATATPTPEPTPIASPTPEPTVIPESAYCEYTATGFTVPAASNDAVRALTNVYISGANDNKVIQIDGYAYMEDTAYDAQGTTIFLVVTHKASGKQIVYKTLAISGCSGESHDDAVCQNAEMSDFESFLDVSWYGNGEFDLGVVLAYKDVNGNNVFSYHEFEDCFTVTDGTAVLGAPVEEEVEEVVEEEETPEPTANAIG